MDDEAKKFMMELMGEISGDLNRSIMCLGIKVDALHTWKPELEARVAELQTAVGELQCGALVHQPHVTIDISGAATTAPTAAAEKAKNMMGAAHWGGVLRASWPWREAPDQGQFQGIPPGIGQPQNPSTSPFTFLLTSSLSGAGFACSSTSVGGNHKIPALAFPQFDGENPRLWKTLCG